MREFFRKYIQEPLVLVGVTWIFLGMGLAGMVDEANWFPRIGWHKLGPLLVLGLLVGHPQVRAALSSAGQVVRVAIFTIGIFGLYVFAGLGDGDIPPFLDAWLVFAFFLAALGVGFDVRPDGRPFWWPREAREKGDEEGPCA